MWLRRWLRATGYEATLVHNITDINDKIYDAAPGASAELAAEATDWYLEDTGDLGLGHARPRCRRRPRRCPQIVQFIEELIARGHAYPVGGDVYFRVASFPEYGRLSGQRPDQVEEQEPNPLKEDPRDFALWKANKPGRGHVVGIAVGPRPAGLAHRVLGDGRGAARPGVRDPRRRARPRLPAPRERGRAVARARPSVRADLGAQRHAPVHRREDVEVARQHRHAPRGARRVGSRDAARVLPRPVTGASRSTSPTRRWRRPRRARETFRNAFTPDAGAAARASGTVRGGARGRLRHAGGARA